MTPPRIMPARKIAPLRIAPGDRWLPRRPARRGPGTQAAAALRRAPLALLVSLGLHLGLAAGALVFLRLNRTAPDQPDQATTVELVMVEHKGEAKPPAFSSPAPPTTPMPPSLPRAAQEARAAPEPETAPPEEKAEPKPAMPLVQPSVEARENVPEETETAARASEPAPPPEPARTTPKPPESPSEEPPAEKPPMEKPPTEKAVEKADAKPQPAAPLATPLAAPSAAPKISLSGTDSPSDAMARGDRIIPAAADAVFHNRPPAYPGESVLRGERGAVLLLIRVSPQGRTAAVDVIDSSGYALLDRAAREAVLTWRFLPAMRGGRAVGSELPMRFIFDSE